MSFRNKLENLLREAVKQDKRVLIDCGYYESSWKDDAMWTEDKYWNILQSCEFSFAFSFDKPENSEDKTADSIIDEVEKRWLRDQDVTNKGTIIPIVHGEVSQFPVILRRIAEKLNPVIIAIPERELGEGILSTAKTIHRIRQSLNDIGVYYPLHLLGTGNPISILIYTICGADSFDGLEWCQMILDNKTGAQYHLQHYDFFREKFKPKSIPDFPYTLAALMHNLNFYLELMTRLQSVRVSTTTEQVMKQYIPGDFLTILKEKLPEVIS
jgi:queuine/archaeosine tRNA-ribosyltransferase